MPIIKTSAKKAAKDLKHFDWTAIDAMSDATIMRRIAADPDAAPDMTEAIKNGTMRRPVKPEQIKAVRRKTGLSQARFATRLRLNVSTIRNWEQGRTRPDGAAVTLLAIIDRAPKMLMQMLRG